MKKIAVYIKERSLSSDKRYVALHDSLVSAGCELYEVISRGDLRPGTDCLLSVGGDGTFLSASKRVGDSGVPVLGVNLGRLGFLSENSPEDVMEPLLSGDYTVEDRALLHVAGDSVPEDFYPYALNEVSLHRAGAGVLGVEVSVNSEKLPVYWADGLLVATSSGSTAYSLSVGGPICTPESRVLIIAPVAPHNLNVRPLIVPDTAKIDISVASRDDKVMLSADNRNFLAGSGLHLSVSMAQFSLKRIRLNKSNFVKALTSKLFWGEDVRNSGE
ncbi:MAG: NAD(+)/NADH kinase [Bacteroidales bacterium]|nr:NAD(+)/NADH kinase [Bacteroidales bacterium]